MTREEESIQHASALPLIAALYKVILEHRYPAIAGSIHINKRVTYVFMSIEVDSFEVDTYRVWQYHYAGNAVPYMHIESATQAHGIRDRVYIVFTSPSPGTVRFPQAFEGVWINSYLNFNQYQSIYSLLQAEDPVYYHYMYNKPSGDLRGETVPLIVFWLATEKEPTGEGLDNPRVLFPLRRLLQNDETPDEIVDNLVEDLPEDIVETLAEPGAVESEE